LLKLFFDPSQALLIPWQSIDKPTIKDVPALSALFERTSNCFTVTRYGLEPWEMPAKPVLQVPVPLGSRDVEWESSPNGIAAGKQVMTLLRHAGAKPFDAYMADNTFGLRGFRFVFNISSATAHALYEVWLGTVIGNNGFSLRLDVYAQTIDDTVLQNVTILTRLLSAIIDSVELPRYRYK